MIRKVAADFTGFFVTSRLDRVLRRSTSPARRARLHVAAVFGHHPDPLSQPLAVTLDDALVDRDRPIPIASDDPRESTMVRPGR